MSDNQTVRLSDASGCPLSAYGLQLCDGFFPPPTVILSEAKDLGKNSK
jgi:hypothetical protein